ncbi:pyridine nucleotide-disulfide oxidoreductase domain-containing protein 2 [Mus musculus]|uniref:Pyridine nucleotide-disulfide oxidoreductase domain-containing protein 2 n=1 Tax=Mus musculus TaxID=10090 RepID=PYRD2_MOUSE|nr:pyridine nucleotide-disulfide oxidoreductase domain-containing protein 2 [Mus musculus]Q3U4I7.3 RecName: Full=Pyridine nucleotide-disulfide oxidoreductase domain-containing protein 2 [Mus musculus]|eukprot:NP_083287.2 pyridine nucleotide-disulfide oxidoreductase domain-containing protein 2 [Mus musculus]
MAAGGRGLIRALHSSPCPTWKRAQSGANGRLKPEYDAVVIGAGHNGLVAAAYLQRLGVNTAVFERRHVIGGAAVTEEIIPGFKFSRASYLLSLLRPQICTDLELKKHGLKLHLRDPYSFTPMLEEGTLNRLPRSLLLGTDMAANQKEISQFSRKDAQAFPRYEEFMKRLVLAIDPLLDAAPVDTTAFQHGSLLQRLRALSTLKPLLKAGRTLGAQLPQYYEVLTAPISKVLDQRFESEPLKATLATDAVIGAMTSPHTPGSGYVLLHHVMGSLEGTQGAWSYVQGGMGALSDAIASSAATRGASIFTEKTVAKVQVNSEGRAQGVTLQDGEEVRSRVVLSCASPQVTFLELTPQEWLPGAFVKRISQLDTQSPVTKINVAVDRLPNFQAAPNAPGDQPQGHHQCSIHLNCEDTLLLHQAFEDAKGGLPSQKPMIELCIPSSLDPTLAPPGCHVVSLFTQYTPYTLAGGKVWNEQEKNTYADKVFDCIEAYAPGFKRSVLARDILTPPDLERIFRLPGGNIFHGAMSLDQLYFARPVPQHSDYRCPVQGLYLCGSGAHPGGGVMGAAGRNAAHVVFRDLKNM